MKVISPLSALLWILLILPLFGQAQKLSGLVIDQLTAQPVPFVHIGVLGKNVGVISKDDGSFEMDLSSVDDEDLIQFSIIGYETKTLSTPTDLKAPLEVKLTPIAYEIEPVVIKGDKKVKKIKIGRYKTTKTTTGQSGIKDFGYGGEVGVNIIYPGKDYYLDQIQFHTRFNTVDSVLYRMNVYEIKDGRPGKSLLKKESYTKSYKKNKWIKANMLEHGLIIKEDIIVTFELIRIWWSDRGDNYLFYTHGKNYEAGNVYSRESSLDQWSINKRAPYAIYVTGIPVEE